MKRLDRAMYAFFLLALLADVARAQVPASFGGDSGSGSIQSVARQIRVGPAGEVVLVSRRLDRRADRLVLPAARNKAANFALAGWARILSAQVLQTTPAMLVAFGFEPESSLGPPLDFRAAAPVRGVFEHTGSPAP
jgi:hypothetical protein